MTALRPIVPVHLPGVAPQLPPTPIPELTFIDPAEVLVDERYQRGLSGRSLELIARIVGRFDWRRWRPPVCVWTDEGLKAIDGQHSLIAAASHPGIDRVPVLVVPATTLADEARTFIGVNSDRLAVTKRQLHSAEVMAGDPTAVATQELCDRLGIRILKSAPNNKAKYAPRDTFSVSIIKDMVRRLGIERTEVVLGSLVEAECAPIKEVHLRAAEHLLLDDEFSGQIDAAELAATVFGLGDNGEKEGRRFAADHSVPFWRGLASVWFQRRKKRRGGPRLVQFDAVEGTFGPAAPPTASSRRPAPAVRVIDRRPVGPVPLAEPEPGRSALDRRSAAG